MREGSHTPQWARLAQCASMNHVALEGNHHNGLQHKKRRTKALVHADTVEDKEKAAVSACPWRPRQSQVSRVEGAGHQHDRATPSTIHTSVGPTGSGTPGVGKSSTELLRLSEALEEADALRVSVRSRDLALRAQVCPMHAVLNCWI